MNRLETVLVALFFACWLVASLEALGLYSLAGMVDLGVQPLFSFAAAVGWLAGNVYARKYRSAPPPLRRRWLVIWLLGPAGLFFLLWAMAPADLQGLVPLAPLYATGVASALFAVPILLGRWPQRPGSGP